MFIYFNYCSFPLTTPKYQRREHFQAHFMRTELPRYQTEKKIPKKTIG